MPLLNLTNASQASIDQYCKFDYNPWLHVQFILMSVVGCSVALTGILGNAITFAIFMQPRLRTASNIYLACLAVYDWLLLILAIMIYSVEHISEYAQNWPLHNIWVLYLPYVFGLSHFAQTGSVYMTVAVTIERFLAIQKPSWKFMGRNFGIGAIVTFVAIFSASFTMPKFFEIDTTIVLCPTFTIYQPAMAPLLRDATYQFVFNLWLSSFVMIFIPFVFLFVTTVIILLSIRRLLLSQSLKEHRKLMNGRAKDATIVLVLIVCLFLVCNIWNFVLTLIEHILGSQYLLIHNPTFYAFSREAVNFLAIVNSAATVVIYYIFGRDYRREFNRVWCLPLWKLKGRGSVSDLNSTEASPVRGFVARALQSRLAPYSTIPLSAHDMDKFNGFLSVYDPLGKKEAASAPDNLYIEVEL